MIRAKAHPPWAVLAILIVLAASTDGAVKRTRRRVVCYHTNWSAYRQGLAKYQPANINPHLCTHLIYAFGTFNDDFELEPTDKYQDIDKGGYARFNGLKQYNKGLRTLLAIGGWNEGSGRFSEMVADPQYRKTFVLSVMRYLRQHNFNGLDLDWEYPGSRAGSDYEDKDNYATLCEELRAAFDAESLLTNRPALLLTVAVPAGIETIEKGYNVPRLNAAVDFFNILAYDYHASTEALTDHHAPLLASADTSALDFRGQLNVDYTVRFYLKLGAERRKLVVGIPTYGRSYTLIDERFNGLQAAAQKAGSKGRNTKEAGYLSFYEICELVAVDHWKVYRPYPEAMGPYATKGTQWVGYDDEFAVKNKAEYVRDNRLGGIMFWSIDNDDFRGRCSGRPYPLIEAAKEAYLAPAPGDPPRQASGPTPPPPATPDPGAEFTCKREGFFPHPTECNKYFWCLAGGPLGIVSHSFTCPDGLLFSRQTDSCDFPRNVRCKVEVKEVESITFPPTEEPTILPSGSLETTGDVTPDPFDQYYEDYDTEDLPQLDLDLPQLGQGQAVSTATAAVPDRSQQVLGSSRAAEALTPQDDQEQESDPQELRELLTLITDLGGVAAVQRILEGGEGADTSGSAISEKDRRTLIKIVGAPPRGTTTGPSRRARPTPEKTPERQRATSGRPQQQRKRTRLHLSRRRRPQFTTEAAPEQVTEVNGRRRQYSTLRRNRVDPTTEPSVADGDSDVTTSSPSRRQYVTLQRQRQRPTVPTSLTEEEQDTEEGTSGRRYVSVRRPTSTSRIPLEPTSPTPEITTPQATDEVETQPATAAAASPEGSTGRPSDAAVPPAPSDTAGVESLLDLTDSAANSLDSEPNQRRIRIRLRRPNERRSRTEATSEAATTATTAATTVSHGEGNVEDFTVAPVEEPTEAPDEEVLDAVDGEAAEAQIEGTAGEENPADNGDRPKIRVIRLKRPRERPVVPTTERTSEIQDNEVTVDTIDTAKTTVPSDVQKLDAPQSTQLDSTQVVAKPGEIKERSHSKDIATREREIALRGNALPFDEGIRDGSVEEGVDPGGHGGEPDFTLRNTLRRLESRRQGFTHPLFAQSVNEKEEEEKQLQDAVPSRPTSGLRRQSLGPTPPEETDSISVSNAQQNSASGLVKDAERPPPHGLRRINLRTRGPVLQGRSRDGSTSASPSGTTQIVTDVEAATKSSVLVSLSDSNTEQPDITEVTFPEISTKSATEASPTEDRPESLASDETSKPIPEISKGGIITVIDKQVTVSVRRPLRRGLIRRLQPTEDLDTEDHPTRDESSQVISGDRTLRRLQNGNDRNSLRSGTIRRRFRQRGGPRRRRPSQQRTTTTTENPTASVEETTKTTSKPRDKAGESTLDVNGDATTTEAVSAEIPVEDSGSGAEKTQVTTKSDSSSGDVDVPTTNANREDEATTTSKDVAEGVLSTEPTITTGASSTETVITVNINPAEILNKDGSNSTEVPGDAYSEDEQVAAENDILPIATPPTDLEQSSPVAIPTISAQDPAETSNEEKDEKVSILSIDDRETASPPGEATKRRDRRPPVRGLFRLRQRGSNSLASELNTNSSATTQPPLLRKDEPRTGLRNRLASQQRTEGSAGGKEAERERPSSKREGLLSQSSIGLDAESAPKEETGAGSGVITREGLLRRVRPADDSEAALEQLTESDKIRPLRVQGGIIGLRRLNSNLANAAGLVVRPRKGGANHKENETETVGGTQATTDSPVEKSTTTRVGSLEESAADLTEPPSLATTETIHTALHDAVTEPSEERDIVIENNNEFVTKLPATEAKNETTAAVNVESTTATSTFERQPPTSFGGFRQRQGATTPGRDSSSVSDRLALLRASLGNRNSGSSITPPTASSTLPSSALPIQPPASKKTEETVAERLQRLRQGLLTRPRERFGQLGALRRRTSSLSGGRKTVQRPTTPKSSEVSSEASLPVVSTDAETSPSPVTVEATASEPGVDENSSLKLSAEDSQEVDAARQDSLQRNRQAPFRRKLSNSEPRPFPIRPSSHRRGSLGSRLRERLFATISVPPSDGTDQDKRKRDDDVSGTANGHITSSVSRSASHLLNGEINDALVQENNEKGEISSNERASNSGSASIPSFQPPRKQSAAGGIAERLKERLSQRPGLNSASQDVTIPTDSTTTQRPTVVTESGSTAATTSTETEDAAASPTLGLFSRTRRPAVSGGLRNSLRLRLTGLNNRLNVDPSPIPAPQTSGDAVPDITGNRNAVADSLTGALEQASDDAATGREEATTEASGGVPTTPANSDQDVITPDNEVVLEEQIIGLSEEPQLPSPRDNLRNTITAQTPAGIEETKESGGGDASPGADVEYISSTTTERIASTRRSAFLRFSNRNRKPAAVVRGTIPGSLQNERATSDLAAKLVSQADTESPLSALRNRLRERLAASIGLGSSVDLRAQAEIPPSNKEEISETGALQTSSAASATTQTQLELSTTESPNEPITATEEVISTSPNTEPSVYDDSSITDSDGISEGVESTTGSDLLEIRPGTANAKLQETEIISPKQEIVSEPPATTAASTSILTTTRPRKLSLVQQLRQRQEQKKSSVKSLVEQLRSSLYAGQKSNGETTTTTTTTSRTTTETATEGTSTAAPEETASTTVGLLLKESATPTEETTTILPMETTTLSHSNSEAEYPVSTTPTPETLTTTVASVVRNRSESDLLPEEGTREISYSQLFTTTTDEPTEEGVVYATEVDSISLFPSTTESAYATSEVQSTSDSPSDVHELTEDVLNAVTASDVGVESKPISGTRHSETTTILPRTNSADENRNTSAKPFDSNTAMIEDENDTTSPGLLVSSTLLNSTSSVRNTTEEIITHQIDTNASKATILLPEDGFQTTTSSQLKDIASPSSTTIPHETVPNDSSFQKSMDNIEQTTAIYDTDPGRTTLQTVRREGRLLQFEEPGSGTARPFVTPTTVSGLIPTGNPGSFVSVKVSVSSSMQGSLGMTESIRFAETTEKPLASTHVPAVDALFSMWSDDPDSTTATPGSTNTAEVVRQKSDTTETDEVANTEGPVKVTTASTFGDTDDDVFVVKASTVAPEPETTTVSIEGADVADQALDRPREASLINILQKTTPAEQKPTLYDRESLLAFSTVTPRYRDPDSLFKRKTYLASGGAYNSPLTWMIGVSASVILWSRLCGL